MSEGEDLATELRQLRALQERSQPLSADLVPNLLHFGQLLDRELDGEVGGRAAPFDVDGAGGLNPFEEAAPELKENLANPAKGLKERQRWDRRPA